VEHRTGYSTYQNNHGHGYIELLNPGHGRKRDLGLPTRLQPDMIESALLCDIIPRQLSFKHTIQLWLTYRQQARTINIELMKELLFLVGQLRVGNRTRRIEPRVIKRRPKAYSMMVKPRSVLRQEIVQNWT